MTASDPFVVKSRSPSGRVLILTLNRPKALNALSDGLFRQLNAYLAEADDDDTVASIVITGGDKVFAAGADIKELGANTFAAAYSRDALSSWQRVAAIRKPIVAGVAGYALGGGCELAMMADLLVCTPTAVFGLPEINLGVIPGAGGTQRLAHLIGKTRTMDMVLNDRKLSGKEAYDFGLASGLTKEGESVVAAATKVAEQLATKGALALQAGKEAVNASLELPLGQGLRFERRLFHALFSTPDMKEGMTAFAEKRKPVWPSRL